MPLETTIFLRTFRTLSLIVSQHQCSSSLWGIECTHQDVKCSTQPCWWLAATFSFVIPVCFCLWYSSHKVKVQSQKCVSQCSLFPLKCVMTFPAQRPFYLYQDANHDLCCHLISCHSAQRCYKRFWLATSGQLPQPITNHDIFYLRSKTSCEIV